MNRAKLKEALKKDSLFDFIANNYCDSNIYEMKELLLGILGVIYDKVGDAFNDAIIKELDEYRGFFDE